MATQITKTFSVICIFSRDDEEDLGATDLNYLQMKTAIKKRIAQDVVSSMGIVSSHISGSVSEA